MSQTSDTQQNLQSLREKLDLVNSLLNSKIGGEIGNLPRVNYLIDYIRIKGINLQRQDNTSLMYLGDMPSNINGGALGVLSFLHGRYVYYNNLYIQKKSKPFKRINDNWLGNEDISKSELRQCQELFLTAYYSLLQTVNNLNDQKKQISLSINELEKEMNLVSDVLDTINEVVETEEEIAKNELDLRKTKSEIIQRNLALYILPAIGLLILGYFIYKRKIKL